ncbi:MAG TPA: hydrogenase iron-sulfur subunit [Thermoplasmata archaeon]
MVVTEFRPTILAFCCNWCSYAGADLAGVSRLQMPPNVHVVRVMCSASVKPEYVMKAISQGMDGVLVLGCHLGDCHYMTGNHRTAKRIPVVQKILKDVGLDEKRVRLDWVSAAEGEKFQKVIVEFVDEVAKLGPNPLKGVKF